MNEFEVLLQIVGGFIGLIVGLTISVVLGAMIIRIASLLLGLGEIPFLNALKTVAFAMFVNFTLNFTVGIQHGIALSASGNMRGYGGGYMPREMMFQFFTPMFMLLSLLASILISAAFFCVLVRRKNNPTPLTYTEAASLSALSTSVGVAAAVLLVGSILVLVWFVSRIA